MGLGGGGEGWGILVSLYGEIRCIVGDDHSVAGGKYCTKPNPTNSSLKSIYYGHKYTEIYHDQVSFNPVHNYLEPPAHCAGMVYVWQGLPVTRSSFRAASFGFSH